MVKLSAPGADTEDMNKYLCYSVFLILAIVIFVSCDGKVITPGEAVNYTVQATLIKDLADSSAVFEMALTKDGTAYKQATVTIGGLPVTGSDSGYVRVFSPTQILPGSNYILTIQDGTALNINFALIMPGEFAIDGPDFREFDGTAVQVQYSVSTNTDGYILATKPPDTASVTDGYEAYVFGTVNTIPPETFILNLQDRILGMHRIYVASYTGSPIASDYLPFDIPVVNNPADNVDRSIITGRISGILIAVPDSIVVETL